MIYYTTVTDSTYIIKEREYTDIFQTKCKCGETMALKSLSDETLIVCDSCYLDCENRERHKINY